jgi:hypothetical protein
MLLISDDAFHSYARQPLSAAAALARRGLTVTVTSAVPQPRQERLGPDAGGGIRGRARQRESHGDQRG